MNTYFNRALVAMVAALSLMLMVPSGASADTGPWQWSDISDKLTVRDNRPVWAIARAEPYWYMTDGQELWSGGHVWKTDGTIVSDITLEVRNAGISRVDDIVSDGQTVIYLKNVVRADNNFEALAHNGSFSYPATTWKNQMGSDEGIASLTGKNGVWMIVTTKGRILRWNQSGNTVSQVTPSGTYTLGASATLYSVRHSSPADDQSAFAVAKAVPTSNGWILVVPQTSGNYYSNNWRVYRYTNDGVLNDLTGNFSNLQYVNTVASNGNQVLIVGGDQVTNYNRAYTVQDNSVQTLYSLPSIAWNRAIAGYNGKSWMIVSNKDLVRFDGTSFQTYGQTRDYFIQTIGNGNGTFLLGGVASQSGSSSPTYPLTAKLVRADEGTGYATGGVVIPVTTGTYTQQKLDTVTGFKNRITYWAWVKPGVKYHPDNSLPFYTVGTQSNDGIKRIDMYINDVYQKTCLPGNTKKNTECSMPINPAQWPLDFSVGGFAKITSSKGRVAYVPASLIRFYDADKSATTGNSLSATMSVSNDTPYLQRGSTSNVYVTGAASEGINRIEIYVNGQVKQTCTVSGGTSGSCSLTLNGSDYNTNTVVSFNGRVLTQNGRETWTWLGQYTVTDTGYVYNNTNNNSTSLSAWVWFDPSSTNFTSNNTKYVMAQATAPAGLKTMDIYVNGSIKQSCSFANVYGTQSCQVTVYGTNYSGQYNIPVYVRATDANGQTANSQTLYLNPTSNDNYNYNYYNNSNGSVTVSTSDSRTSYNNNETVTFNGHDSDSDGIQKIELYANGTYINGCSLTNATYGSCSASVLASTYANGTTLPLQAKATDRYGNVTWSNTLNLTINNYSNNSGSVSISTADGRSSYGRYESFTVNSSASDNDGIQRLEIYVNGASANSCYPSNTTYATCSTSVTGSNYTSSDTTLSLQAKATDRNGNVTWSDTKSVSITGYNNNNSNGTVTVSTSDGRSTYNSNETITFKGDASDSDGIQKIELYSNSSYINGCSLNNSTYGSCSASVTAPTYANGTTLPLQAKATDRYGNVTWSNTLNVTINPAYYTGNQNNNDVHGTITLSSNADSGYTAGQQITYTATGSDANGIKRLEIYVGSDLVKTCDGTSTCSYTGGPYDAYQIIYGAKLIDQLDNTVWSGYKYIYKK